MRILSALLFLPLGFGFTLQPGKILLQQKRAVLGEPVVVEVLSPPMSDWGLPYIIEVAGPERACIRLSDYTMIPLQGNRLNLSPAFKTEGRYVISIFYDWSDSCFDADDDLRAAKRKDGNLFIPFERHEITVDYPVDFDKALWVNTLSATDQAGNLWGRFDARTDRDKETLEEILRHPESDYFPWAVYAALNHRGILAPMGMPIPQGNFEPPPSDMRRGQDTEKLLQHLKLLDEVEKRWKRFPFLDELMLAGATMAWMSGDVDKAIERTQEVLRHSRDSDLTTWATEFLKKLKAQKAEKKKQKN